MDIRVAVVEDQRLLRELLAALLERQADIEVVGTAETGKEAIEMSDSLRPDVLLLDIGLPDLSGIEVARIVREKAPRVRVIALSIHSEPHVVREILAAGARGYVLKSAAVSELIDALRTVMAGSIYLSPDVAHVAVGVALAKGTLKAPRLGRRETEVVGLVAEGKSTREIAERLGISPATVEVHRRNIMRKLGLHSVAQLTKFALRHGLTSL
jgi:DNA-binding NarL/FixJ family response regulator